MAVTVWELFEVWRCLVVVFAALLVHSCGAGGIMRACYAAGPGSIPDRDKFPGWGFFRGFSSPVRQMSGSLKPPRSPNIIWPSLSSLIIHYGRQWPEMLTHPKTSHTHTHTHTHHSCVCVCNERYSHGATGSVKKGLDILPHSFFLSIMFFTRLISWESAL